MTNTRLDIAASPRRIFTVDEANRLLPAIEDTFRKMDEASTRARELSDLVADLEAYWGKDVEDEANEDHEAYGKVRRELSATLQTMNALAAELNGLGCELKDPNRGLVDFYAYVNGELAFLCWHRGENAIGFWHTLEGGFAGRRPLVP